MNTSPAHFCEPAWNVDVAAMILVAVSIKTINSGAMRDDFSSSASTYTAGKDSRHSKINLIGHRMYKHHNHTLLKMPVHVYR